MRAAKTVGMLRPSLTGLRERLVCAAVDLGWTPPGWQTPICACGRDPVRRLLLRAIGHDAGEHTRAGLHDAGEHTRAGLDERACA
jgi:hypothetical protein